MFAAGQAPRSQRQENFYSSPATATIRASDATARHDRCQYTNCVGCLAPVLLKLAMLIVIPVVYLVLMYLTFVSQK
jgi:hypothetical protein